MNLNKEYFELLKSGHKDIEIRLLDKKRNKLEVRDIIIFKCDNQKIYTIVLNLYTYPTLEELINNIEIQRVGNFFSKENLLNSLYDIYPKDLRTEYKALAIEIEMISD